MAKMQQEFEAPEAEMPKAEGDERRVRRAIMLKMIADRDTIMRDVVAKGKGTHVKFARLIGLADSYVRKTNDVNGRPVDSVALFGSFECHVFATGEIIAASSCYLPMAFADPAARTLEHEPGAMLKIDIDLGAEATGKTIPYEWTVTNYIKQESLNLLDELRNSRTLSLPNPNKKETQA